MVLLFLNSLGTLEVVVILFAVLILFGSKGIPDVVRNLGRGMNEIRNASNEIKKDIQKAGLEMRKDLKLDDTVNDIKKSLEEPKNTLSIDSKSEETDSSTDSNLVDNENDEQDPETDQKDLSA